MEQLCKFQDMLIKKNSSDFVIYLWQEVYLQEQWLAKKYSKICTRVHGFYMLFFLIFSYESIFMWC